MCIIYVKTIPIVCDQDNGLSLYYLNYATDFYDIDSFVNGVVCGSTKICVVVYITHDANSTLTHTHTYIPIKKNYVNYAQTSSHIIWCIMHMVYRKAHAHTVPKKTCF